MKRLVILAALAAMLCAGRAQAQNIFSTSPTLTAQAIRATAGAHSSTLNWATDADATTGYNVYEQNGACPATAPASLPAAGFSLLNSAPIAATTYTDSGEIPGTRCFFVTAVGGGLESNPSNDVADTIKPAAPTGLTAGGA